MKSTRFRECLIEIAMLCEDTQVTSFIYNIDDLDKLFNSLTPNVINYLEGCFDRNKFTRDVQSVTWL